MTTEAKRRKSSQVQQKAQKQTTSKEIESSVIGDSLKANLKHLRETLSVDTFLDDINQEEALEFLDAVESDILDKFKNEAELKEEITDSLTAEDLINKLKDVDVDRDQCEDLIDIITEDESDLLYDFVRGKGYVYVKIDNLMQEEKLREFIEKEIYPNYRDQVENIMF